MHESLHKTLQRFFRGRNEVRLAYLFGSQVRGLERSGSDIDIAVLLNHDLERGQKFTYRLALMGALEDLLRADPLCRGRRVDLILLNAADPLLAHQVIKYGQLVFERRKKFDSAFRVQTMTRYFDARPLQQFFFKRAMQR